MSEYKSRRERRLAQGGKAEHHGGASPRIALVVGLVAKKKRKAGGRVEGEAAKHHLGKRARGGQALNSKQDADDPDGPDRLSEGRPEFAVAMGSPRARGGSTEDEDCEMAAGGHVHEWIGHAREVMEKKGTVGSLHRALGVPESDKIPEKKLAAAARRAPSGSVMQKKIQFAENVRK